MKLLSVAKLTFYTRLATEARDLFQFAACTAPLFVVHYSKLLYVLIQYYVDKRVNFIILLLFRFVGFVEVEKIEISLKQALFIVQRFSIIISEVSVSRYAGSL